MASNSQPIPASCDAPAATRRVEYSKINDDELMAALKAGDAQALSELFLRYRRPVMSICTKILRDHGEAEDVTQEVFIDIYQKIATFDPKKGCAKNWILRRAHHDALNRRDYLSRRRFYDPQEVSVEDLSRQSVGSSSTGWLGLTDEERVRILTQAMATLSPDQRSVLELACFDGLRVPEISERTEQSIVQVRHFYHRGLKKLQMAVRALISRTRRRRTFCD